MCVVFVARVTEYLIADVPVECDMMAVIVTVSIPSLLAVIV